MSAVDNGRNSLAGLTLDAILGNAKPSEPPSTQSSTLLDIIRDDMSSKEKKSWKTFRDKLRLKRAGSAWTSSVPIPASDVNVHSNRSQFSRRGSFRSNLADSTHVEDGGDNAPGMNSRMQSARRSSVRFGHNPTQADHDDSADISMPSDAPPSASFRPQMTRHHSTRLPATNTAGNDFDGSDDDESPVTRDGSRQLTGERALSAREAVAAQEAAEAAAAAAAAAEQAAAEAAAAENKSPPTGAAEEPVTMSLMDLLGETGYSMGDDDDEYDDEEEEEEEDVVEASGGIEYTCCVCMVRHKGSAFIPCGHTFCRLCSRELFVQRGNCPLCNGFILEILDIF